MLDQASCTFSNEEFFISAISCSASIQGLDSSACSLGEVASSGCSGCMGVTTFLLWFKIMKDWSLFRILAAFKLSMVSFSLCTISIVSLLELKQFHNPASSTVFKTSSAFALLSVHAVIVGRVNNKVPSQLNRKLIVSESSFRSPVKPNISPTFKTSPLNTTLSKCFLQSSRILLSGSWRPLTNNPTLIISPKLSFFMFISMNVRQVSTSSSIWNNLPNLSIAWILPMSTSTVPPYSKSIQSSTAPVTPVNSSR